MYQLPCIYMLQIDVKILDGIYQAIHNYPERATDIAQSFKSNQIRSKMEVVRHIPSNSSVCLLGGWYAIGFMLTNTDTTIRFTSVDIDRKCMHIGKTIAAAGYKYIHGDALTFNTNDYDVVVNCSTEHMDTDRLQFSFANIEKGKLCIFQNNDNYGVEGHINCFPTVNAFCDYIKEQFNITEYSTTTMDNGTTRYTIICTKT